MTTYEHVLHGCAPVPLAGYLKALGVFRLVAEQADPDAHGFWRDERFVLRTRLTEDELVRFLSRHTSQAQSSPRGTGEPASWRAKTEDRMKGHLDRVPNSSAAMSPLDRDLGNCARLLRFTVLTPS